MQVISLSSLIEVGEESEVLDYLSSFSCVLNHGVENFLKNQAIESEKRADGTRGQGKCPISMHK